MVSKKENLPLSGGDKFLSGEAATPPKPKANERWNRDVHEVLGGKAVIFRTKLSGGNYQVRIWLPAEKRYYTRSLRVKDLETAIEKAEKEYIRIISEVNAGFKIFSITFRELADRYIVHQQVRVDNDRITAGRLVTIKSQLKHFLRFVGEKTKVDAVKGAKFQDYYNYRKKHAPRVQDVTLRNERATISNLYRWGAEQGYLNRDTQPKFEELRFSAPRKRNAFTVSDYQKLYKFTAHWFKQTNDQEDKFYRKLTRDFILVLANTGLRFGECRQLRWQDVEIEVDKRVKANSTAYITVRKEIAKTRRERLAVGLRGDVFLRIKQYSPFTGRTEYIFPDFETGEVLGKDRLYRNWKSIIDESGLRQSSREYSYYSLRHFFATMRLQEGKIDVFTLAKIMGTSVKNIEDHYGQVQLRRMSEYITRRQSNN